MKIEYFNKDFKKGFKIDAFIGRRISILLPMARSLDGHFQQLFSELSDKGFIKVRVDGVMKDMIEGMRVDRTKTHNIDLVLDRFQIEDTKECLMRLDNAIDDAKKFNINKVILLDHDTNEEFYYTT